VKCGQGSDEIAATLGSFAVVEQAGILAPIGVLNGLPAGLILSAALFSFGVERDAQLFELDFALFAGGLVARCRFGGRSGPPLRGRQGSRLSQFLINRVLRLNAQGAVEQLKGQREIRDGACGPSLLDSFQKPLVAKPSALRRGSGSARRSL